MEGIAPPTLTREQRIAQYLEALNTARSRYDQAVSGELRPGEDRWQIIVDMQRAQGQAKQKLLELGTTVSYSLATQCYEEEGHAVAGAAATADTSR